MDQPIGNRASQAVESPLQFVRKFSGFNKPSAAIEAAFNPAADEITASARTLVDSLATSAQPRGRMIEMRKARESRARPASTG
jgi:hypothetical protein